MKSFLLKKGTTFFLRAVIFVMALAVLALCIFGIPPLVREVYEYLSNFAYLKYPTFIGLYITAVAFFLALWEALKLLSNIDKNIAFSESSIASLKKIKYFAVLMSGIYLLHMPVVFWVADKDDAPGLIIVGMVFACAPIVVAVFGALLQKLLETGMEIKSENDLTV